MTVTRAAKHITFTAVNESYSSSGIPFLVESITFQGSGLTAGQRLTIRDTSTVGTGNIVTDYVTGAEIDNADLWGNTAPTPFTGLSIDNNTIAGTWVVTVKIRV